MDQPFFPTFNTMSKIISGKKKAIVIIKTIIEIPPNKVGFLNAVFPVFFQQ